jgi:F420-non-reducing hydrogenase iron-sulfur subunit
MCSGRVDPVMVIDAMLAGIDGVLVVGCRTGECHYVTGNVGAETRMNWTGRFLEKAGLYPRRLSVLWVSSAEDEKVIRGIDTFIGAIRELGPLGEADPVGRGELKLTLRALREVVSCERVRWLVGKSASISGKKNVFGESVAEDEFEKTVMEVFANELRRKKVLLTVRESPSSVIALARKLGFPPAKILRDVVALRREGLVSVHDVKEGQPTYAEAAGA